MKSLFSVLAVFALTAAASWGSSISLFSEPGGASCNLSIPPGGTGTFYVVAVDAEHAGLPCSRSLQGAAFTIAGLPAGWVSTMTPPLGAHRDFIPGREENVYVVYDAMQYGYLIPLLTVTVTPVGPVTSATLTVQHPADPLGNFLFCPLILGAGWCPPDYTCVDGGILYINEPGNCLVSVAPVSWSEVKKLYE